MTLRLAAAVFAIALPASASDGEIRAREIPTDCKTIEVPAGGALATKPVWLEEVQNRDPHYYDGVYTGSPRQGGYESHPFRERVQLEFASSRQTFPWEKETFEACLAGRRVHVRPLKTAYRYDIQEDPQEPGNFFLTPGERLATDPDPDGIELNFSWDERTGCFALHYQDRWAQYYGDGWTIVEYQLMQERNNAFDFPMVDRRRSMSGESSWEACSHEPGRHYVKWRFFRVGGPSRARWSKEKRSGIVAAQSPSRGGPLARP